MQRVFFIGQLLDFVTGCPGGDVLDIVVFLRRLESLLRSLLQWPMEASGEAAGADQARGILYECVVVQDAKKLGFDISRPIERVQQQAAGTRIQ